jgi:hypothetical protein
MKDFALAHPWMTFWIVIVAIVSIGGAIQQTLRAINIAGHGWPPAHLDADGSFKNEEVG